MTPPLWRKSEQELKSLLMKVKVESEKVGLTFNIQKTNIMASDPITSRQIDGEKMETVTDFILWGSKITADGDCSHELNRHLLLGRKVMNKLDNVLKSETFSSVHFSHSVMSDSVRPHGLQPTRLLYPWDFPGRSTRVGCHCLLLSLLVINCQILTPCTHVPLLWTL